MSRFNGMSREDDFKLFGMSRIGQFWEFIKACIGLFFLVVIPMCIFFSPFYFAFSTGNYWLLFLFFVTWIPALFFAKFISIFHD